MPSKDSTSSIAAELARKLAAETATKAAELATTTSNAAVALASKTAESMAIISTDIAWMKKSLCSIEDKLNEMDKSYVTATQHAEVIKGLDEHEARIYSLETEKTKTTVMLGVGIGIMSLLTSLLIWHLVGK